MDLRPRQLIAVVIGTSAATALLVSVLAFGLLTGEKPSQVVERILEPGSTGDAEDREITERVLRQDEIVVGVVRRVSPAVVSIVATKDVPVVEQFFVNPFDGDPFLERFFGDFGFPQLRERGTERRRVGAGTGFVVSTDGLILTNKHVVADTAAEYTAFFNDGTKGSVKVLARDPVQDLAVLRIDPPAGGGRSAVTLGDSSRVEIGQTVIAIGNALGEFQNTVSVGVVSGLHRSVVASGGLGGPEELSELIQTDAAINPGNSGGPLLNLKGEVIGINVAMAQGAENIGFAVPIAKAKRDLESVKATGRIIYPFLGVRYVLVNRTVQEERKLPVDYGVLLVSGGGDPAVVPGSPADKAGLREGDVILEFNGERIDQKKTLASHIQDRKAGDTVSLKVRRGGEGFTVSVKLEERK
ncbi:MAG: trypsin-like peptidase domain-containing protein [Patescibacteria group bacterium]